MEMTPDLSELIQGLLNDPAAFGDSLMMLNDDGISTPCSPIEEVEGSPATSEEAAFAKQREALRTYIASVPYACESFEEMDAMLAHIVDKMYVCAKSNQTDLLWNWDGILSTWLLMRYPISKAKRIKLLHYYYELCLVPGTEPHLIRERTKMFSALLPQKHDSMALIESQDLELDWRPLWRILKKELWPMKRLHDPSRNTANLYIYLAELSRRYFPEKETKNMLSTILPLLTQDTFLSIIPVLTSFLPFSQPQVYLPALFAVWEAFNSNIVDDRMIELMGDLAEEHVSGTTGPYGEAVARWCDIGIWDEDQWIFLMGKCLGSMNVPMGALKGASTTAGHADIMSGKNTVRIKKPVSRQHSLAKLIIYSMSSVDVLVKSDASRESRGSKQEAETGYLAGSKALDSLAKIITSAETFLHPSNTGHWTLSLSNFLQRLASEFCKRWKEEEDLKCKTPVTRRLTPAIRRAFVLTLRTPMLLALFAKDPISMGLAQGALRSMAMLEPGLVMPQLLERAYGGLEVVNETHRTTAVMSMLSGIALPLVSERIWQGGQRHLVPLLELCLPGIDLNDPAKTICAAGFICAAVQHIKIGDLDPQPAGLLTADDAPSEGMLMDLDAGGVRLPNGTQEAFPILDIAEERAIVRDSTAGFADWVTSLFRRVFALYENLPEEGGRKNTTGGKSEEAMLKSVKNVLDVVCLHLSDTLFDLVLKIVYEYATTNTKANAVRALGQLVACLARNKPQQTIDKFLPFSALQIKEELKHGASSVRTTSSHAAVPSDTTLHWNISILRGCLGYGGPAILKHRETILDLISVLIEKTKSERGYSGSGRLVSRLLHTLSGVYPINGRFVNTDEWETSEFNKNHNIHWGRFYSPKDVKFEWHVPKEEEIAFIIQILEQVAVPLLAHLEKLLNNTGAWDNISRNDFCRYLYALRSVWSGLPTLFQEVKRTGDPCLNDGESDLSGIYPVGLSVKAGFILTDPRDPRYQTVINHRAHYGRVIHHAAVMLRGNINGEDHIDAVIGTAIEVYLLEYGTSKSNYSALQKNYAMARDNNRMWPRQKENTRLVFLKRAQVYHNARMTMHAMNRCRSEFDVLLFDDLIELSLSPYTRIRNQSQHVLFAACNRYPLSTHDFSRLCESDSLKPSAFSNRAILNDVATALLNCQHQEKPSIQKLVSSVHHDLLLNCISEESLRRLLPFESNTRLSTTLDSLRGQYSDLKANDSLLSHTLAVSTKQTEQNNVAYERLIANIIEIARRPTTHWRYLQMAIQCLVLLLRRDIPQMSDIAKLLVETTTKSHISTRTIAQRGLVKLLALVKIRSYSKSDDDLWFKEWKNPLQREISVENTTELLAFLQGPFSNDYDQAPPIYVDKIKSGFLVWESSLKAYSLPDDSTSLSLIWEPQSRAALASVESILQDPTYFPTLISLWSQETDTRGSTDLDLRSDNFIFMKTIAKMFEDKYLNQIMSIIDPLLSDPDRFKQRAAAEVILGLLRGSKHWLASARKTLWDWFMAHVGDIYAQMKPDTAAFWEILFQEQLADSDPQRSRPLIDWVLSLPLEFHSDSVFSMSKSTGLFMNLANEMGIRFGAAADRYINMFFDNAHTGYAEIRNLSAQCLYVLMSCEWNPSYPSVDAFLAACNKDSDPLGIRRPRHIEHINQLVNELPTWRLERLPHPRVNQSQVCAVFLLLQNKWLNIEFSLIKSDYHAFLSWIWTAGHGSKASSVFPYVIPVIPEILKMTELNDDPELLMYSTAVLYILSAVTPPREFIKIIAGKFISTIKSSSSWKIKLNGLPILIIFFYRNLVSFSEECVARLMDAVIACLSDENVEVREMAAKLLSGLLRCSQRRSILPLRNRFVSAARNTKLPKRQEIGYTDALRKLHAAILGLCALVESFPYSIEPWMPPLTEVLAPHASDPPPISTTIRKCASEFKKARFTSLQQSDL
ncbi:hypothetical protein EW145_g1718 [Phellinidium pouzarii]|uniref:Proteasome activator Blm10 mid region domain-containing protein n=1 Tax=Phellinidium pouzarii TaxID=167371 RepID=A0A4S4LF81_9AGAM|nr:hypothetical protein EW145_g1718 [Phellinidium pouzarii]